jgi:glutamate synthase (NADPH/NADH) large chain
MPHLFFKEECSNLGIDLPEPGSYGVGMVFFSTDYNIREKSRRLLNKYIKELGFVLLGYREVPVNNTGVGPSALTGERKIEQVFVKPAQPMADTAALERRLYLLRNFTTHAIAKALSNDDLFYIVSFSYKVIIYKGQLRTNQLRSYYLDLNDSRVVSALALIHSRFSTNTFPKWKLAQPFRYIAHNGEINTIRGNINWMKSKEAILPCLPTKRYRCCYPSAMQLIRILPTWITW